eukprot:9389251-Pyramimonas_sp.AAC.2
MRLLLQLQAHLARGAESHRSVACLAVHYGLAPVCFFYSGGHTCLRLGGHTLLRSRGRPLLYFGGRALFHLGGTLLRFRGRSLLWSAFLFLSPFALFHPIPFPLARLCKVLAVCFQGRQRTS